MNKKIILLGTMLSISIPLVSAVSCTTTLGVGNADVKFEDSTAHEYLFEKNIQDSNRRAHMDLSNLSWERLTQLPSDMAGTYGKDIVATGFGEKRSYYLGGKAKTYHAGIDVMRPEGEILKAPFDAQVIAQYWYNQDAAFASGIGGLILLKTKISDLHVPRLYKQMIYIKEKKATSHHSVKVWSVPLMSFISDGKFVVPFGISKVRIATKNEYDSYVKTLPEDERNSQQEKEKYIFVSFMHLSKASVTVFKHRNTYKDIHHIVAPRTINGKTYNLSKHARYNTTIDFEHPYKIRRGQKMGYIGNIYENGGWEPHVHIEAYYYSPSRQTHGQFNEQRISKYDTTNPTKPLTYRSWYSAKAVGTFTQNTVESHGGVWLNKQHNTSAMDPNNLFQFYDENTPTIFVK